jgi:hypothetical protein
MLPLLEGASGAATAVRSLGSGRIVLLADPSPVRNGSIVEADNARFAVALAGPDGRAVEFVERVATPPGAGLGALPSSWWWVFGGLLLAALTLIAARARRLGPPDLPARELPPPRKIYVDAIAASLARTRSPGESVEPVRALARERVLARGGLATDLDEDGFRAAARSLGLDEDQVRALVAPVTDERGAIDAGRALTKLAPTRTTR